MEEKFAEMMAKKEGDEEPVKAWKEHNEECQDIRSRVEALSSDCHLMHRKVDQIASCLGIALYHPGMEQHSVGGPRRHTSGRNISTTLEVRKVEAVLHPSGRSQFEGPCPKSPALP